MDEKGGERIDGERERRDVERARTKTDKESGMKGGREKSVEKECENVSTNWFSTWSKNRY